MWPGADPEAMARGRWALAGRVVRDASDASEPAPGGHGMDKGTDDVAVCGGRDPNPDACSHGCRPARLDLVTLFCSEMPVHLMEVDAHPCAHRDAPYCKVLPASRHEH